MVEGAKRGYETSSPSLTGSLKLVLLCLSLSLSVGDSRLHHVNVNR